MVKMKGGNMRKIVMCIVAVLLLGSVVMAEEADTEIWQPNFGMGQLFGVNLTSGQLVEDKGTCYFADILPPFNMPIINKEANTKLVGQLRERQDIDKKDLMLGGAISIEGINFFEKEVGQVTISSGIDPTFLTNLSYTYRWLFEKEEFDFGKLCELDGMVYLKFAF